MRYHSRESLAAHQSVQRTYALNDEAALLICDYGKAERPRIPFSYYAEAWTGVEYSTASLMMFRGMTKGGVRIFDNVRARFDGERRNPWDEPEYGHHYSRAMAAWSGVLALSGFRYHGGVEKVTATPRIAGDFSCLWSSGTGWGRFQLTKSRFSLKILHGTLAVRSFEIPRRTGNGELSLNGKHIGHRVEHRGAPTSVELSDRRVLVENDELTM